MAVTKFRVNLTRDGKPAREEFPTMEQAVDFYRTVVDLHENGTTITHVKGPIKRIVGDNPNGIKEEDGCLLDGAGVGVAGTGVDGERMNEEYKAACEQFAQIDDATCRAVLANHLMATYEHLNTPQTKALFLSIRNHQTASEHFKDMVNKGKTVPLSASN